MKPLEEGALIETDVLCDYLVSNKMSLLRTLLRTIPCYTTVINAAELFSVVHNENERLSVYNLLGGLRVMGLNARYAVTIANVAREARDNGSKISERDSIIAGTCVASRLPLITVQWKEKYQALKSVRVVSSSELSEFNKN
jgi:predicted nucleic acid-binding protein